MQQLKVSMVMPCYNKVQSIGEMFDSVLAQEWNAIELILVNDGSADGTREIIADYEQKFLKRGYEVIIIDQENAGVCAAAKVGLERVTGDLVCMVDSDDELDPKYVSTMAGWLMEHEEYDFAACEGQRYTGRGDRKQFQPFEPKEIIDGDPYLTERWLLADFHTEPWRYLLRVEYFRKCRIVETYHTRSRGSHEPGYIIPILAHRGKLKYFPLPLYNFNVEGDSHSRSKYSRQAEKYFNEYLRLCKIAIEALPDCAVNSGKKQNLISTASISYAFRLYQSAYGYVHSFPYADLTIREFASFLAGKDITTAYEKFIDAVNAALPVHPGIKSHRSIGMEYMFFEMVKNCFIAPKYRIVGCGAQNESNANLFRSLAGTPLEPTELWDDGGDGVAVKHADYASLTANDISIVGPCDGEHSRNKIMNELGKTNCLVIDEHDAKDFKDRYSAFPELITIGRAKATGCPGVKPGVKPGVIPVVFSTDDNYAPYLGVALSSLIHHVNHSNEYAIYILHARLSAKNIRRIKNLMRDNVHIEFINVKEEFRDLDYSPDGHVSIETVYRMIIPDILPQYDKVIYLDCDLIVLQDIALLYALDIGDSIVGAAKEIVFDWLVEYAESTLKMKPSDVFNAGVLIINSRKFKEHRIKEKCFELLMGETHLRCWDQDALNIACGNNVTFINERWNSKWGYVALNACANPSSGSDAPCIIHYHTGVKPWRRPDIELAEHFWEYARESAFYEEILFQNFNENAMNCFEKYLFPFNIIKKGANVVLYGAGKVGEAFFRQLKVTRYANLLIWCDKNHMDMKRDMKISDPMEIANIQYDHVLVAIKDENGANEIIRELVEAGIDGNRIIWSPPAHFKK